MPKKKIEIDISSDTLELENVESFVRILFDKFSIKNELFNKIMLCINEAVVNSIIHGNKFSCDKKVRIQCYSCKKYLYIRIIDQGKGFNFKELPDPTDLKNIFKETGRGIYIIKQLTDEIAFRDKGNIIEFKIELCGKD